MSLRLNIPIHFMTQIHSFAEQNYPRECCGVAIGSLGSGEMFEELIPCANVQDQYHHENPKLFPRSSREAYLIDPKQLLAIQKKIREKNKVISLIYHSHVDADAYFSDEDKRMAMHGDEPLYPGVYYYIVSVVRGKIKNTAVFAWSHSDKEFLKHELV